jgi:hypothetical protein
MAHTEYILLASGVPSTDIDFDDDNDSTHLHVTQSWRRDFSLVSFFDLAVHVP